MSGWLLTLKGSLRRRQEKGYHYVCMSCIELRCWCEWMVNFGCANTLVLLVSRADAYTSYRNVHHVRHCPPMTTTCISYDSVISMLDTLPEIFRKSFTSYYNVVIFWIHLLYWPCNEHLTSRRFAFIPQHYAAEHRYTIGYWYHMSGITYIQ